GVADVAGARADRVGARVTVTGPGAPVWLAADVAGELLAAVDEALANAGRHAGRGARAWVHVDDDGEQVSVVVRDDGVGIPPDRLAAAERAGRLGVAQSIVGRLRALGGDATIVSSPGTGTEVELRVPRSAR
ncbi:MAG: sensor histidine kinase, partial [Frankiaceae bacterium]